MVEDVTFRNANGFTTACYSPGVDAKSSAWKEVSHGSSDGAKRIKQWCKTDLSDDAERIERSALLKYEKLVAEIRVM